MIQTDFTNMFSPGKKHGLTHEEFEPYKKLTGEYLEKIQKRQQGFYTMLDDTKLLENITGFSKQAEGKFQHIVILGIGGSALGAMCLQQSLCHLFSHEFFEKKSPHLYVLDNIDPTIIREIEDVLDYEKTLFLVITKSGSTPETLAQYFYFRARCDQKKLSANDHFVFITDPRKGFLREVGQREGIPSFSIPENVGGRFSVLSSVGLLPAALLGFDTKALLKGAQEMRDIFLNKNFEQNILFQFALAQFLLNKKGKTINVLFPYSQKLIRFADWYRQLLAESIGKKYNDKKQEVYTGLTPVTALGVTDQHSQSQLYNEGPNDKFFIFLNVQNFGSEIAIPAPKDSPFAYLHNISFQKLFQTGFEGTRASLTRNLRPNITLTIDEINASALGGLFLFFEGATAFLGELYGINTFDQPGVELSKQLTKELLLTL